MPGGYGKSASHLSYDILATDTEPYLNSERKCDRMSQDVNKPTTHLVLFQERSVRRVWYQERWFFSVIDVIAILTESDRARKYWSDLKTKLIEEGYVEVSEKIGQLKMEAADGKWSVPDNTYIVTVPELPG